MSERDLLRRVCDEWVNGRRVLDGIPLSLADEVRARLSEQQEAGPVIQHVYTRAGRAAVVGIPGSDHDCDAMACSSVEHIIARVAHTEDESHG